MLHRTSGSLDPVNKFKKNFFTLRPYNQVSEKLGPTKIRIIAVINKIRRFLDIFEIDMSKCPTFLLTTFFDNLASTFSKSSSTYLSETTCLNNPNLFTLI